VPVQLQWSDDSVKTTVLDAAVVVVDVVVEVEERAFFFDEICFAVSAGAMLLVHLTRSSEIKLLASLDESIAAGISSRHSGHFLAFTRI
jgi:hypothetical protein